MMKQTIAATIIALSASSAFAQEAEHTREMHFGEGVPKSDLTYCIADAVMANAPAGDDGTGSFVEKWNEYVFDAGSNIGSSRDGKWLSVSISADKTGPASMKVEAFDMGPADVEESDASFHALLNKDDIAAPYEGIPLKGANATAETKAGVEAMVTNTIQQVRDCMAAVPVQP